MIVGASPFRSVSSLLAVVLVLAGVVGLMRRAASPTPGTEVSCPDGDPTCGAAASATSPLSTAGRVVDAEPVCRNAGYLCAGLEEGDRYQVRRWTGFQGTLVVGVPEPPHEDRGLALRLQRAASAGIRAWNGQPFPILVDERGTREAHVRVEWTYSLGGSQIGRAETQWSAATGLQVRRLVLATRSPFNRNAPITPEQIRLIAAHEMGHALGLPHSNTPRDVMYPTNTASSLTTQDYRTLEALYELEDGIVLARQ